MSRFEVTSILTVIGIISEDYRRAVLSVVDDKGCEFSFPCAAQTN